MYPIAFESDYVADRNRLTTFFRMFMVIPHLFVLFLYGIAAFFTVIGAWVMVSLTGQYPSGLYAFNSRLLRYQQRVNAYLYLMTDEYPSFSGAPDPAYPARVDVAAPATQYSRAKAFFRLIVGIPVFVAVWLWSMVLGVVWVVAWVVIVVTGQQPRGLQELTHMGIAYCVKAGGYMLLLTEDYPPLVDRPALGGAPGPATLPS